MTSDDAPEPDAVVEEKLEDNALWDYYRLASKQDLEEEQQLWSEETIQETGSVTIYRCARCRDFYSTDKEAVWECCHTDAEVCKMIDKEVFSSK
jgi:hypothetical protein